MAAESRQNPWATFLWGSLFLGAGLIFWLDRLDRLDAREWIEWWPVVLLVIAATQLLQRRWVAAIVYEALGLFFLLPKLGYGGFVVWDLIALWPLLISAAGVTLIVQTLRRHGDGSQFRAVAVMAGNHIAIGSQQFAGGHAIAVMGGCEIDLAAVKNTAAEATIDVLSFWGGIEIRVPRGWEVINRVTPILGGFEDRTVKSDPGAPRLVVRGTAIMGGVEVKHWRERGRETAQTSGEKE